MAEFGGPSGSKCDQSSAEDHGKNRAEGIDETLRAEIVVPATMSDPEASAMVSAAIAHFMKTQKLEEGEVDQGSSYDIKMVDMPSRSVCHQGHPQRLLVEGQSDFQPRSRTGARLSSALALPAVLEITVDPSARPTVDKTCYCCGRAGHSWRRCPLNPKD